MRIANYNYIYNNSTTPYFGTAIRRVVLDYSGESSDYPDILIGDLPDSNRVVIVTNSINIRKGMQRWGAKPNQLVVLDTRI